MGVNSKLAELRKLRSGEKNRRTFDFDEDKSKLYDEYDDREYEARQRHRLREDDFVIDDDGKGYVDNGEYEWDNSHYSDEYASESESHGRDNGRAGSRSKRKATPPTEGGRDGDIASLFRTQKRVRTATNVMPATNTPKIDVDDILNSVGTRSKASSASSKTNILGTGSAGTTSTSSGNHSKSSSTWGGLSVSGLGSGLGRGLGNGIGGGLGNSLKLGGGLGSGLGGLRGRTSTFMQTPTRQARPKPRDSSPASFEDAEQEEADSSMIGTAVIGHIDRASSPPDEPISLEPVALAPASVSRLSPSSDSVEGHVGGGAQLSPDFSDDSDEEVSVAQPNASAMSWPAASLPQQHSASSSLPTPDPSSDDSGLASGNFASAQWNLVSGDFDNPVTTQQAEQGSVVRLFWTDYLELANSLLLFGKTATGSGATVLLRGLERDLYLLPKPGHSTDDVAAEIAKRYPNETLRTRSVTLRDAFTQDKQAREYLHLKLPYTATPPEQQPASTYSECHGASSRIIESFLVGRKVMGPCWLDVEISGNANGVAWTGVAVECSSPAKLKIVPESEQSGVPPLTLMSIAVGTQPNSTGSHEVVSISVRVFKNVPHDTTAADAAQLPSVLLTGIRPPDSGGFPPGFKEAARKHNASRSKSAQVLITHTSEKALLGWFFGVLQSVDPDVFIGHSLTDVHLATLLDRAVKLGEPNFSRLGRLRRTHKPNQVSEFEVGRVASGRLLVDLKNMFGREIAQGRCSEFTLEEMTREFLQQTRKPFDTNIRSGDWLLRGAEGLLDVVRRSEYDTLFVASIAIVNQMLPLSLQLTQLAGNPWKATLRGTRSGRNDFLLMHEFTKAGWLIPERPMRQTDRKRNKKYEGGKVFDPEKGLYQSCVLVMDFNSLYPSIIQEYNICFTTVQYDPTDVDTMPEVPSSNEKPGVLPKLLQNLVQRRQEVKRLMKSQTATRAQLAEWEIRQMALKLTANSMYGCLGSPESRFAAQQLAMLVTSKGRETLTKTKQLAEGNGMRVLYGDTDSVMIDTHAVTYEDAHKIGAEFKKIVNQQYRRIELDIDNVFRELLLYQKKKYAAVIMSRSGSVKMESKGLDLRRREYSDACKIASNEVLKIIFGLQDSKVTAADLAKEMPDPIMIFEHVVEYMAKFGADVRDGKLPPKLFIIRNQLSKDVEKYDQQTQHLPQVRVAKARIAAGFSVKAKDVVSYIIAEHNGDGNRSRPHQERAMSPEDLAALGLHPDYGWYLENQIFKPIDRICANLDVYDEVRLGEALGIQVRVHRPNASVARNNDFGQFESASLITLTPDAQRFHNCAKLRLHHTAATGDVHEFEYSGLSGLDVQGVRCSECSEILSYEAVALQVDAAVRRSITRYYDGWLRCDECECFTKSVGTYTAKRCPQPRCKGSLSWDFSGEALYTQMCYFSSLFDASRVASDMDTLAVVSSAQNRVGLPTVSRVVDKYLDRSAYSHINLGRFFAGI